MLLFKGLMCCFWVIFVYSWCSDCKMSWDRPMCLLVLANCFLASCGLRSNVMAVFIVADILVRGNTTVQAVFTVKSSKESLKINTDAVWLITHQSLCKVVWVSSNLYSASRTAQTFSLAVTCSMWYLISLPDELLQLCLTRLSFCHGVQVALRRRILYC